MRKKRFIDISTEEKKKEVFEIFDKFDSKSKVHEYFGISDNTQGVEYIKEIAAAIGFDLNLYKERRKKPVRYCKQCGKEITNKWGKHFCSSSCAAKYNNERRDKSVYEKIGEKLRKEDTEKQKKHTPHIPKERFCVVCGKKLNGHQIKYCCQSCRDKNDYVYKNICECCGKEFETHNKNARYCSNECSSKSKHIELYEDFLKNNEKYCRSNYTPKPFKKEFLKEQGGVCAICGCKPEHNGRPLVFVLDHINGDASDNRRENLRMVCPNCDSQLDTFKSKNKHSTRRNYWKEHILKNLK